MKKIARLMTLAFATFMLASCEDVPSPFGTVAAPNTSTEEGSSGELPYSSTNLNSGWTLVDVTTNQPWSKGSSYVQATGYQDWDKTGSKTNKAVEGWLVSPAFSTKGYENVKFSFDHTIRYTNNVSGWEEYHKIYATSNYNESDPKASTWVEISCKLVASPYSDWTLYSSGEIQLPTAMTKQDAVRIAFWFKAPSNASTTWELKNFTVEEGVAENNSDDDDTPSGNGEGTENNPYDVAAAIAKASMTGAFIKGYIVGSISGQAYEDGATFSSSSDVATNILLAGSADETDAKKCMPVQLPTGAIRTALNLKDNPGIYKKEVLLYGDIQNYFNVPGIKNTSYAVIDGTAVGTNPNGGETPTPSGDTYTKVTSISDGQYAIAALKEGSTYVAAQALTSGYGYLKTSDVTLSNNAISPVATNNVFTFKTTTGGYTIQDSDGQYLYMTGTYNSFNRSAEQPSEGAVWTVSIASDGAATIKNVSTGKTVQYSAQYTSYGAYTDVTYTLPCIFSKEDNTNSSSAYTATTTIANGNFVLGAKVDASVIVAVPLESSKTYGYLGKAETTETNGAISTDAANEFTFKAVDGGYTIQSPDGRYLYMKGTYNSFNVDATAPTEGHIWTVTFNSDKTVSIKNVLTGKTIQYSTQYGSYGSYTDISNTLPTLYKK